VLKKLDMASITHPASQPALVHLIISVNDDGGRDLWLCWMQTDVGPWWLINTNNLPVG
jgi:hypothetical protein